ncbi:bifunctional glycosyltransferase/CDP-glycerol:glycerophosphate glycerophosphotransferase [Ruania albidiflava]|uniref:bifunctional glycosyltransferase/CDP-glycerol:glycerophosphate glycerophosphotransferase n=1 Tax=Ruania albidiflava TaxID=366586 RepID=UPI0003B3DEAF|nr:CDP-glycerol glycerophosphotransferase family protein [Ruania albidiflava]
MANEGNPARLAPSVAAAYLDAAEECGGPTVVERTALRTRSRQARDLLAYAAAPGGLSCAELLAAVRAAQRGTARAAPPLDPRWAMSLVRVIGMQNLDEDDLHDAVSLLLELRRQHGRRLLSTSVQETIVARLWEAGEHQRLRSWLPQLPGLRAEQRRFLQADLMNPFRTSDTPPRRAVGHRWQSLVDEIFADHGIEAVRVRPSEPTAFDGLTCAVEDDPIEDGPLVTVILTVFRPGPALLTAVRSICAQTWRNLEILVVNDASPGPVDVLDACAGLDERVRVHRMDRNEGTYVARNAALDLARGELVTFQDADDWSHPRRIELQAKALLASPWTPATRSYCLRVSEDLVFQRPGYETSQENASSLMFRREQVLTTIGYFDRARKSADTEFRRRLEIAFGAAVRDVRAPLAMVRMAQGSLSRADFTPGWHHVSRYVYRGAYERWHAHLAGGADPYLPRFQERRRFAVPQRFQVDQDVLSLHPPHYDLVLLCDWRFLTERRRRLLEEATALGGAGYRVGLAYRESYVDMSRRRLPLRPEVLDAINEGTVDFVALDQVSTVSTLVVGSPDVLQFAPAQPSTLTVHQVVVLAGGPPDGSDPRAACYDPAWCDATVTTTFRVEAQWLVAAALSSTLVGAIPPERVHDEGPDGTTALADLLGPPQPQAGPERRLAASTQPLDRPRPWVPAPAPRAVVIVSEPAAPRLLDTLRRMRDEPQLLGVRVTVVHSDCIQDLADEAQVHHPGLTFVSVAEESRSILAIAACEQLVQADEALVTVATLPKVRDVHSWARRLRQECERVLTADLHGPFPLLVRTRHTPLPVVASYLELVLARNEHDGRLQDYLAGLALLAGVPRVEAIDPGAGELLVSVWLAAKFSPTMPQPGWRYRLVLARAGRTQAATVGQALDARVDTRGQRVWEALRFTLPLERDDGNFTLLLEVDTQEEELRVRRRLRPAKGLLLAARTAMTPSAGPPGEVVRYLPHTTGGTGATILTMMTGRGWRGRVRWAAVLLRKDLGSLLRRRSSRRMALLRAVRLLTRPFFLRRPIWLVGERTDTAQDNGLHLFQHLRRKHPERRVYYIIDPRSTHRERVDGLGNVVDHSSWRHQLLMLHATVLANAYSIRYLTPRSWGQTNYVQHVAWRTGALRIYLKHGVHLNAAAVKRGLSGYDMLLTVMPAESAALRAGSGYDRQIREIGMPRYDGLTPAPPSRTVLFMPTWRQYLVPRLDGKPNPGQVPFEESAYEQFITGLLHSPRLHHMLEQHDYRLTFVPHYNMASYFDDVPTAERISLADTGATSFQELLRGCDAFITDYSSVHFDVAYLGTPVIYARFDEADYEAGHASRSWFDYERDGYGPVVRTITETLDALEEILSRNCTVEEVYAQRVAEAFTYRDQGNSARVVAAIDDLLRDRQRQVDLG